MRTDMRKEALAAYQEEAEGPLAERLRFLAGLADIQDEIASAVRGHELHDAAAARDGLATGQPIFLSNPPSIAREELLDSIERVASYIADAAGLEEVQAAAVRDADFGGAITRDALGHVATATDGFVAEVIAGLGAGDDGELKPATVAYILLSALTPFFVGSAGDALAALGGLDKTTWTLGVCPVCGSPAAMGMVGEVTDLKGGERELWCGLCHTSWAFPRLQCVRCGNGAANTLHYVHVEDDPAHRLHLCDECHGYTRIVFAGDLHKPLSMFVEDGVTAPLDALARSKGYSFTGKDPVPVRG